MNLGKKIAIICQKQHKQCSVSTSLTLSVFCGVGVQFLNVTWVHFVPYRIDVDW